jgi:hypothetical protein
MGPSESASAPAGAERVTCAGSGRGRTWPSRRAKVIRRSELAEKGAGLRSREAARPAMGRSRSVAGHPRRPLRRRADAIVHNELALAPICVWLAVGEVPSGYALNGAIIVTAIAYEAFSGTRRPLPTL